MNIWCTIFDDPIDPIQNQWVELWVGQNVELIFFKCFENRRRNRIKWHTVGDHIFGKLLTFQESLA